MSNLFLLTKIYIKQIFGKYLNSKKLKSKNLLTSIFIIAAILVLVEYSVFTMLKSFLLVTPPESKHFILVYGLLISAIFCIFMIAYEVPAIFYKAKDYETLASLPINSTTVVSAKFISGYFTALVYNLMFSIPTFIVYFINCGVTFAGIIFAILSVFLLPMFVMFVGCLLGFVINSITSKLKNKTIFNTIFMFVFLVAIFALSFFSGMGELSKLFASGTLPLWMKIVFPYIWFCHEAVFGLKFVYFIYFLLVNLGYLALAILVVTSSYKKVNSNLMTARVKVSKKPLAFEQKSQTKALFGKEVRTFFGSTVWSLNTLMTPIMLIVMAVSLGTTGFLLRTPDMSAEAFGEMVTLFKIIYLVFVSVFSGMCLSTCCSISMEGKKIQILKQLPVSFKQIAFSKIGLSLVLTLPAIYVANIIYLCFVPFDLVYTVLVFVISTISVLTFSILGLVINLRFPKLEWNNESEACKQSLSLFASMFGDMLIGGVPAILFFLVIDNFAILSFPLLTLGLVSLGWFVICLVVSIILLKCFGKKLFAKIS